MSYQRIVLKLGTNVLTAGGPRLSRPRILELVRQVAHLHADGFQTLVEALAEYVLPDCADQPDLPAEFGELAGEDGRRPAEFHRVVVYHLLDLMELRNHVAGNDQVHAQVGDAENIQHTS